MTQTRSPRGGPRQTSRKIARAGGRAGAAKAGGKGPGKGPGRGPEKGPGKAPSKAQAKPAVRKPSAKTSAAKTSAAKTSAAKTSAANPRVASDAAKPTTPALPPKRVQKDAAAATLATGIQTLVVEADEADMRLDRFLAARFPQLAFTHLQRIIRTGQLRVDGKRMKPNERLAAGQSVRVPPLKLEEQRPRSPTRNESDAAFLQSITLYEDKDVLVLNKPAGLASQGGSGTTRHVDGLLEALRNEKGEKPRLVHRLDKETAGCLVVAKSRFAASVLAKSFRSRVTRKVYWAIVAGVPKTRQGRVSSYIAKEMLPDGDSRMRVAKHGDEGAEHALTYYAVVEQSAQKLCWVSLKPVTGRTHQLRVHMQGAGHPIIGDPKYFDVENWELPGGIQNRLHLLARRIVVPHPRTGRPIDVTAPLPPHMQQTFNLLGLETDAYDPIVEAPEE
ncbi:RluA family pseudouridine synthase [Salinarimonas ramus]|uniref:Ribosomal large subunit pseudouridine synthase D n=1 Tax=Salinarimonas ramus TaxID=690164 RepID=A0A917QIE9_9HYPH|nr:RluA family pseudouridine synthase [Salinarimonas ramus]GGK50508.1 pseudouridine synthase [Salinarimonas ramus]